MPENLPDRSLRAEITPTYGGIFADRILWNQDSLNQFVQLSDLRTNITISDGDLSSRNSLEQIGDTLALKKTLNLNNPFVHTTPEGELTTTINLQAGEAAIHIHHQRLAQRLRDQSAGNLADSIFIPEMTKLICKGLTEVLAEEKKAQLLQSIKAGRSIMAVEGIYLGLDAIFISGMLIPGVWLTESGFGSLMHEAVNLIQGSTMSYELLPLDPIKAIVGMLLIPSYLKVATAIFKKKNESRMIEREKGKTKANFRFMHKDSDLNPLNHLFRFYTGNTFLRYDGSNLAQLSSSH